MERKRFIIAFGISLIVYSVLDFGFNNMMLYIMGGVVGGSISEAFKAIGVDVGMLPIALIWMVLLIGVVALFYRLRNKALKYVIAIIIAALLYVVDILVAGIPYSETEDPETVALISNIVIGVLVLSKSLILSVIVYYGLYQKKMATAVD